MNKHKSKASKAFSLIELSIVILIIGIIIAGIAQSSRLVRQSKVKSAVNLTQTSPVNGMRSVVLWLETSQDESFASAMDDGTKIAQWNDTNPQTQSKLFAMPLSGADSTTATYKLDGINGIPSINFDGAATGALAIATTNSTTIAHTPVITNLDANAKNHAFTSFIVYRLADGGGAAARTLLFNGKSGTDGWGYASSATTFLRTVTTGTTAAAAQSAALPTTQEFATITYTGYNSANSEGTKTTTLYINGNNYALSNTANANYNQGTTGVVVEPTLNMYIGAKTGATAGATATLPFSGYISEVIIFDSVLITEDLKAVGDYLSKKYNIPLQ